MSPQRITVPSPRTKLVIFGGGVNQEVSNIEMRPGELNECNNYEEIDGEYHGYRSVFGFERYEGVSRSIEYPKSSGSYIDAIFPSDIPVKFKDGEAIIEPTNILTESGDPVYTETGDPLFSEGYDGASVRESIRSQIDRCPGIGNMLAVFEYQGSIYAIRESAATPGFVSFYQITDMGYTIVPEFPTDVPATDFLVRFSRGQLSEWPSSAPNTPIIIITTTNYDAIAIHRDVDTDVHTIEVIANSFLPVAEKPTIPLIFNGRIMLAYPKGHLFFGNLGTLTFDPVTNYAGEFFFGSEITDMVATPGDTLMVWMERGIKAMKPMVDSTGTSVVVGFKVETFSDVSGSIARTAARFLGTMIYCDDRGVVLLDTSSAFGDFKASSVSKKVYKTYLKNKDDILGAWVDREKNHSNVIFPGGSGISFTFDIEKKVKGATLFNYEHSMVCGDYYLDSVDGNLIFGDSEGYVQVVRETACSFDGKPIKSFLSTAYHSYGSPTGD